MIGKSKVLDGVLYLAICLFIYMPFHIFLSTWLSTYTGGLDFWKIWKDILTAFVTILCIAYVYYKKVFNNLYNKFLVLISAYGLIHLILFFTTDTSRSAGILGSVYNLRIFCFLIIGYSLALLYKKTILSRLFFKILIIVSTIVCLFAIAQFLLPKDIMSSFGYSIDRGVKPNFFIDDKPDLFRAFSTLRDPNSLGAFLILPIVFLFQKMIQYFKTDKRLLVSGLFLLHIWVLFLTFSRSTLLATILALFTLVILEKRTFIKKHSKKIVTFSLLCLLIIFGFIYIFRDQYVVQNVVFHADESTVLEDPNELRVSLFQDSVEKIANEPLGYGPGTAGLASIRTDTPKLTENYYLQIMHEVGIFGFLVFTYLLIVCAKSLWVKRKNHEVNVLLASFVGLSFACLLFHLWTSEAVSIGWFMLAGLVIGQKTKN